MKADGSATVLAAIADEERREIPPQQPPAGEPQQQPGAGALDAEEAAGWAAIPFAFGQTLAMAMPELQAVYTEEACKAWGDAMAVVAKKYGWKVAQFSPWIGVAGATVPLAIPTYHAIQARRAGAGRAEPAPAGPERVVEPAQPEQRRGPSKVEPVG